MRTPGSTVWGICYLWVVRSVCTLLLVKLHSPGQPQNIVHSLHEAERAVMAMENHLLTHPPPLPGLFFPSTVFLILDYFSTTSFHGFVALQSYL